MSLQTLGISKIDQSSKVEESPFSGNTEEVEQQVLQSIDAKEDNDNCISSSFDYNEQQGTEYQRNNKLIGTMHSDLVDFFEIKEGRDIKIASVLQQWQNIEKQDRSGWQNKITKQRFIELCTNERSFLILKGFHMKQSQGDQIFAQTYFEKETQENDKHSAVIHKACQEGAVEQQISLLVNSHLQKQEQFESTYQERFIEQQQSVEQEYLELIESLYESSQHKQDGMEQQLNNTKLDSSMVGNTNNGNSILSLANSLQHFATPSSNSTNVSTSEIKPAANKLSIALCLGMQKKRQFEIQIVSKTMQNILSASQHLKKLSFQTNPHYNFIYGPRGQNAVLNLMTNYAKLAYSLKRYFKFRTDVHFPSFQTQYQEAISRRSSGDEDDIVVTRHSCCGKANYLFTITKKEESKKTEFIFLKSLFKIANQLQIEKIYIPIQFIVSPQKDIKSNTEILKEFCVQLKRELQILSYDYSYTQQFLKYIQFVLPLENARMKEFYDKIREALASFFG